ncbi:esterase-like activity of phytase family protein [Microvirga sp. 17 mud 1-3]|uniref:esterase-like activity of phytase family protein n=1 Tax=Microvirga sp. 17 mud 1-3 TaxID=2082949 RepID=UPI000D6BE426|nr:esterase-like activity of phytase family protein [Microvirga sp. 17 mud 1-3]AWM85679.1 twin-arginine translocation pathway signal [Microvirga sp. 17 mud 1-3]
MRLNRRLFLLGGGVAAAGVLAGRSFARPRAPDAALPVEVSARPIDHLSVTDQGRSRFGDLQFRGGLDLRSSESRFGGFSGLWRSADGRRLVSVADNAQWLTARALNADGRLAGLADAKLAPLLSWDGRPLGRTRYYDTESLTISGGVAYVGIERRHAIVRFEWDADGVAARARPVKLPDAFRGTIEALGSNQGLEAIGVAPPRSPLAGALVAVAESPPRHGEPIPGFILTGAHRGEFSIRRSNGYDVSDLAFLPSGDMLLLERQFSIFGGFRSRLRRVAADAVKSGAEVDGAVIYESDASHEIDNMEGLAVHQEDGSTVLTLISDNNFSPLQRTLLLEFSLEP